jgi:outer membrane protein OmpU
VSANAEVAISGGASITFTGGGDHVSNNGWSMNDALDFTWGGELDNGMTVDLSFKLDNSDGAASQIFDNRSLKIGMDTAGTLTFWGQAGSGVVGSYDDKMPTAYEESFDGADGPGKGASASNMFYYTNTSVEGVQVDVSYEPSSAGSAEGSMEFGVVLTAVEGLTVGFMSGEDKGGGTGAEIDNTIAYITYAFGPVTVGYQMNESDDATAAAASATAGAPPANGDEDYEAIGISYAVNEDLSISYGQSEIDYELSSVDNQESTAINASYTMGSMAWSIQHAKHDNANGVTTEDYTEYEVGLAFSF